jgi:hypothetical protein
MLALSTLIVIFQPTRASTGRMPVGKQLVIFLVLAVWFVACSTGVDIVQRGTLHHLLQPQRTYVALLFRAAYFSVFAPACGLWLLLRRYPRFRRELDNPRPLNPTGRLLAIASTIIVTLAFMLNAPANAYNLVAGPAAYLVGATLTLPVIGAIYGTDGTAETWPRRVEESFLSKTELGWRRSHFIIWYPTLSSP